MASSGEISLVVFAPRCEDAARRARRFEGAAAASPRQPEPLHRALADGTVVELLEPRRPTAAWKRACRRLFLPAAPGILVAAISGISRTGEEPAASRTRDGGTASAAFYLEGTLTDLRAQRLLSEPKPPRHWIVEDFRRLRLSPKMIDRLDERGVRLSALKTFPVRRRRS